MSKRIFYGFTVFVILFTLVAWQYAAAELAELRDDSPAIVEKENVNLR